MKGRDRFRRIGRLEIAGGGQVFVQGDYAYIGHLAPPDGTSVVDVSNPRRPRVVSHLLVPLSTHSHKVRVHGDLMLVNYERFGKGSGPFEGGFKVFDIADRAKPREIAFWRCGGVHRFFSDERYAYISPEMDGYLGNIAVILDLGDPANPKEVARCWHAGFRILDISDLARPRVVGGLDWSPPYPSPTHTALPVAHPIRGRHWLVVTDEDVDDRLYAGTPGFMWLVDITDETRPVPVATYNIPQPKNPPTYIGSHQPHEAVVGNLVFVTWFRNGLRVVDIADPYRPREVGAYLPQGGPKGPMSNDVFVDARGLVYLMDRYWGLDILEFSVL